MHALMLMLIHTCLMQTHGHSVFNINSQNSGEKSEKASGVTVSDLGWSYGARSSFLLVEMRAFLLCHPLELGFNCQEGDRFIPP